MGTSILTGMLALGVVLGLVRTLLRLRRDYAANLATAIRWFAILAMLHVVCAVALRYALIPPVMSISAETLEVRTGGAPASSGAEVAARVVALPEAEHAAGAVRAADLASALRRYLGTRRIRVTGAGLAARDRDAARNVVVEFLPAPLPAGLVELHAPPRVAQGAAWTVRGRVEGMPGAKVQLLDPAGVAIANSKASAAGTFALLAHPRAPGPVEYSLRTITAGRPSPIPIAVPVVVTRGDRLQVTLIAGAPGPELKYLRRWALDAGLDVRSDIALGAVSRLSTPASNNRRTDFEESDLVVLDDRAWRALGAAGDRKLLDAARAGSGVLLRITGPLGPSDRERLALWGFGSGASTALPARTVKSTGATSDATFALRPPSPPIAAPDARILSGPHDHSVFGLYRVEGRGRLALWWATDSYRLVLRGDAAGHGALWSRAFAEIARPRSTLLEPRLDHTLVRVGERQFVCNIDNEATVRAPDGQEFRLLQDTAAIPAGKPERGGESGTGAVARGCAAFWPRVPGWHEVLSNAVAWPFHVRARLDAPGLLAHADREATLQLAARSAPAVRSAETTRSQPRWPWFLGWLAATAALWWLERASIPSARR